MSVYGWYMESKSEEIKVYNYVTGVGINLATGEYQVFISGKRHPETGKAREFDVGIGAKVSAQAGDTYIFVSHEDGYELYAIYDPSRDKLIVYGVPVHIRRIEEEYGVRKV